MDFTGDYYSHLPVNAIVPGLPQGTNGKIVAGKLSIELPEIWELSAWHKVSDRWDLHYGFTYSGWNKFTELRGVRRDNGDILFYKNEGFKNNIRVSMGTTYHYTDDVTLRAGIAYDDSRIPENNHSISIPDQDRYWLTTGTTMNLNRATSFDIGVAYMMGKKISFTEKVNQSDYNFDVKGKAWLYAFNINYIF